MTRSTLLAAAALLLAVVAANEASAQMGPGGMNPQYQRHLAAISQPVPGYQTPRYQTPGYQPAGYPTPGYSMPSYPTPSYHQQPVTPGYSTPAYNNPVIYNQPPRYQLPTIGCDMGYGTPSYGYGRTL